MRQGLCAVPVCLNGMCEDILRASGRLSLPRLGPDACGCCGQELLGKVGVQ